MYIAPITPPASGKKGTYTMMASPKFDEGIALARSVFIQLDQRRTKWRNRNVPIYIRQMLWRPYYLTENKGEIELYIIQPPGEQDDKVHFVRWVPPAHE